MPIEHPVIKAHELRKEFEFGGEKMEALRSASFTIQRGEIVSIVGQGNRFKFVVMYSLLTDGAFLLRLKLRKRSLSRIMDFEAIALQDV